MKKYLIAFALLGQLTLSTAQTPASPSESWAIATKMIQNGKYAEAVAPLESITQRMWDSPLGDKACALLIEAQLLSKAPKKAAWNAKRFLDSKPASVYRDRVESVVAFQKIQDGNVFSGVEDLFRVFAYSKNPAAKARAKDAILQVLASSLLGSGELQSLVERNLRDKDILAYLNLQLGREHQTEGRWKAARLDYSRVIHDNEGTPVGDAAQQGLSALEDLGNGMPSILVVAPLSGDYSDFGLEMVQGALLAYEEFTAKNGKKLLLRIVDDRADPVRAIRRVQNAMENDAIVGIVGPMMSPAATAVGAWLATTYPQIPMITPTATDEGIASLGTNVFQLNVPTASLARSVADYALRCLDAHEFAIFSPLNDYGRIMSDEFSRQVELNGGRVLSMQYYQEGNVDYQTEFNRVRARKLSLDNRRRNIAKGVEAAETYSPKGRREYMEDSLLSFDAIIIPTADPKDAATIASHTAFNKIGGTLLGSSGWYGKPLIVEGKRQVENSYFSVPFTEVLEDSSYQKFLKSFQSRWDGHQPGNNKVSGLSYDAMRVLMNTWIKSQGNNVPQAILAQKTFPGVYGTFEFAPNGANVAQHIMSVRKGKFTLSDQCPTEK
jgi:ABC-type branched-subunit amino acid transport system substrate-binding protein/outer membrane protein assembly factor BamD (BamD/ComL family)